MAAGHPNLFLLVPEGRSAGAAFRLRLPWERPERRGRHGGGEASAAQARPDAGELAEGSQQSVSRDPPEQVLLIAAKGDRVIAAVKLYPIAKKQEVAGDNLIISVLPEKNEAVASSYKLKGFQIPTKTVKVRKVLLKAIITDSSMPHVGGTTCGTKFYCAPELDGPLKRSTKMMKLEGHEERGSSDEDSD
uniref:Uncharacterized protein n=1 Tax=Oryza glumipatula TaxID=40148 RepID=A0A0E0A6Q6_9ORYZ